MANCAHCGDEIIGDPFFVIDVGIIIVQDIKNQKITTVILLEKVQDYSNLCQHHKLIARNLK